jgi:hypothetical protein
MVAKAPPAGGDDVGSRRASHLLYTARVKRAGIALLAVMGLAVAVAGGGLLYLRGMQPAQRPASTETIERTPARLARGPYLVDHVLGCMDCHARRDLHRYAAPVIGPAGAGGDCLGPRDGIPGRICPPNLTPDPDTGLGAWTDGEILRALREGVARNGRALFPRMPYSEFRALSDEDARAVVVYLRTLPPVQNAVLGPDIRLPVRYLVKLEPRPLEGPVAGPDPHDRAAAGAYLGRVSGCLYCHTPVDSRYHIASGQDYSGGHVFPGPWGVLRSSNLTPHPHGLGGRDARAFVGLFKAFAPPALPPPVDPSRNTIMPWLSRAGMTEDDLAAIHAHLTTLPPVDRVIESGRGG